MKFIFINNNNTNTPTLNIRFVSRVVMLAFFSLIFFSVPPSIGQTSTQPNILWIVTDDHRADAVEVFNEATIGQKESKLGYVDSPCINKFAKEGTLFVNAYCNSPACAPSRASMMTGQYPHHNGITGFELGHNQNSQFKKMLPTALKEQGYGTSIYGKLGYRLLSWNSKEEKPTFRSPKYYDHELNGKKDLRLLGFTDFVSKKKIKVEGKTVNTENFIFEDGKQIQVIPNSKEEKDKQDLNAIEEQLSILRSYTRSLNTLIIGGESPRPAFETYDGYILKEYQNYLNNPNKTFKTYSDRTVQGPNTKEPQFLSLNFQLPHTPILPPKSFRDKFKNKTYRIPDFDKAIEHKNLPPQLLKLYKAAKIDGLTAAEKQQAARDYYAFCAYADALIGKAIDDFKAYNEKHQQEYVIILTIGDHGWHLGEQGIEAKFAPYKTSNQGAIILAGSNTDLYPKNKVCKTYVEYVDIYTTALAAAKVDLSKKEYQYLDGYDMAKLANGKGMQRAYVIGEMNHVYGPRAYIRGTDFAFSMRIKEKNDKPNKRVPPGTGLEWAREEPIERVEAALFDLRVDPEERNNVALHKEYKHLSEWFRKKLTDIVLGDGRVEIDWRQLNVYSVSDFAIGADDKKLAIPSEIIPKK